jgi:hypothetical protein
LLQRVLNEPCRNVYITSGACQDEFNKSMQQPKKNCIEDENLHIIETLIKMEKYLGSNPNSNASMLKTKLVSYIAVLFSEPFFTLVAK